MRKGIAWKLALVMLACIAPVVAHANDYGVAVRLGTLGLSFEGEARFAGIVGVRGTASAWNFSSTQDEGDISYDGKLKLGAYGVLVDVFPMRGGFHLSAGLLKVRNRLDVDATPSSNTEIGSNTYTPGQIGTLSGDVKFKSLGSYVGLGWGAVAKRKGRVGVAFDMGALYQGAGDASLAASGGGVAPSDLRQEEQQFEDDIKDFKLWPVITLGIAIRI